MNDRIGHTAGWLTTLFVVAGLGFYLGRVSVSVQGGAVCGGKVVSGAAIVRLGDRVRESGPAEASTWNARWAALHEAKLSKRDWPGLAEALEQLALTDPEQAMKLAGDEINLTLRAKLQLAVLRGWSKHEPEAAVDWALKMPENMRAEAGNAILAGASVHPETATAACARLCAADEVRAYDYTQSLLTGLADVGAFELGVRFVEARPESPQRLEEMNTAFSLWAAHAPVEAAYALQNMRSAELREEAARGLAIGWAQADPAGLANYALTLPAGTERAQALANALPRWMENDAVAAVSWIRENGSEPHPDFDSGVLAMATSPAIAERRPELAVSLAEGIADVPLRTNTLRTLALKWAETDMVAARRYVEGTSLFSPEDRSTLLTELKTQPRG